MKKFCMQNFLQCNTQMRISLAFSTILKRILYITLVKKDNFPFTSIGNENTPDRSIFHIRAEASRGDFPYLQRSFVFVQCTMSVYGLHFAGCCFLPRSVYCIVFRRLELCVMLEDRFTYLRLNIYPFK